MRYGVLDVHETDNTKFNTYFSCVFIDCVQMLWWNANRWNDTGGVAGMNARQLDMLMDNEAALRHFVERFLEGDYKEFG